MRPESVGPRCVVGAQDALVPSDAVLSPLPSDALLSPLPSDALLSPLPLDALLSPLPLDALLSPLPSDAVTARGRDVAVTARGRDVVELAASAVLGPRRRRRKPPLPVVSCTARVSRESTYGDGGFGHQSFHGVDSQASFRFGSVDKCTNVGGG